MQDSSPILKEEGIQKIHWMGDESDDMSEVKRMKFTCDDTEVWDRAEEIFIHDEGLCPVQRTTWAAQIHSFVWRVLCHQGI